MHGFVHRLRLLRDHDAGLLGIAAKQAVAVLQVVDHPESNRPQDRRTQPGSLGSTGDDEWPVEHTRHHVPPQLRAEDPTGCAHLVHPVDHAQPPEDGPQLVGDPLDAGS